MLNDKIFGIVILVMFIVILGLIGFTGYNKHPVENVMHNYTSVSSYLIEDQNAEMILQGNSTMFDKDFNEIYSYKTKLGSGGEDIAIIYVDINSNKLITEMTLGYYNSELNISKTKTFERAFLDTPIKIDNVKNFMWRIDKLSYSYIKNQVEEN